MNKRSKISPGKPEADIPASGAESEVIITPKEKSSLAFDFQQILLKSKQYAEFEKLDISALHEKSNEAGVLSVAALAHLWMRLSRKFQNN